MTGKADEVTYFRLDNSDTLIACVGTWGNTAMFRLGAGDREWEFLVPESPAWDGTHRAIYARHRADSVAPSELPPDLPSLPEIPKGPFPKPEDYVLPKEPVPASQYPYVTEFLKARDDRSATVFVVLDHSTWDTGDPYFFYDVFLAREDAQRCIDRNPRKQVLYYLRALTIKLDGEALVFPGFRREVSDCYSPVGVLQVLELRLPHKASWVCDFDCDRTLEEMLAVFNGTGPWQWRPCNPASSIKEYYLVMRNYIEARPSEDVRVRTHEGWPAEAAWYRGWRSQSEKKFTALLEIKANSSTTQAEVDEIFCGLLAGINATNIAEIKPFD